MAKAVQLDGARQLRRDLKRADKRMPAAFRQGMKSIAEPIARDAARRAKADNAGSKLAESLKAFGDTRGGGVKGGTPKLVPYYGFMDFGGRRPRDTKNWHPRKEGGRYIYPAIEAHEGDIERDVGNLLDKVLKEVDL